MHIPSTLLSLGFLHILFANAMPTSPDLSTRNTETCAGEVAVITSGSSPYWYLDCFGPGPGKSKNIGSTELNNLPPNWHTETSFYNYITGPQFQYGIEVTFYPSPDPTQGGSFSLAYGSWSTNVATTLNPADNGVVTFSGSFSAPIVYN